MSMEAAAKILGKIDIPTTETSPSVVEAKPTETPVETKPTETPAKSEEKAEEKLAPKFAALAKKEKAIVERDQKLKQRESDIAKRESEIAAREAKIKSYDEMWNKDVWKILEEHGYDYSKLTDLRLRGELAEPAKPKEPTAVLEEKIAALEAKLAERDQKNEEAKKRAEDEALEKKKKEETEAVEAFKGEVKSFVTANKETYELIDLYEQHDLILETIQSHYDATSAKGEPRVLSVKEAADAVEAYLVDLATQATKTKKFAPKVEEPKKEDPKPATPATKTLTNDLTPSANTKTPARNEKDRMARALAALNGQR